jgi:hydrogenase nickel incorporation protein HypB
MTTQAVRQRILAANEEAAGELRRRFEAQGTLVMNLISAPGSGKTSLLEATVPRLKHDFRIAAVEGDIATERDADRLRRAGCAAYQIVTGGACHLDARLVREALAVAGFGKLDMLFIENVGNLVCPTAYDLGEDFKVAVLSVTEGDDKPVKYPGIFTRAAVTVINKMDLLPYVDFDIEAVTRSLRALNPNGLVLRTSMRAGEGLDGWLELLKGRLAEKRKARG